MPQSPAPSLHHLDHFVLTVADIPKTVAFYEEVLGMRAKTFAPQSGPRRYALTFGDAKINLHQRGAEFEPKAANPLPGSADLCFLTKTPLNEWADHLAVQGVPIEKGPVPRTGATGPLLSIYLRDPDGNLIEISTSNQTA
ncbi:VOC family protein [Sulfitobacter sp. TSTF-M16]|uniref:VOC family protein n=1 Tax=Sulfitobacter aestuariivivens TaxID=2766981 RepID=A0A927D777_9RHOB|nr:VOC family protein [Sulfitobacter aestuariivivens]MBD3664817.1 VOC family protein [Sulfitobacter aestuariivivens]